MARSSFSEHLQEELKKYGGIMVPVKAGLAERLLLKKMPVAWLHPNPEDEFSFPEIGPNPGIINKYISLYKQYGDMYRPEDLAKEPLMVEKVHPDGYMLLNGHHRWAAYWSLGVKLVPVSIINLTQETDIEQMIRDSKHDRRATLDLDEVVFCHDDEPYEKPRGGVFGRSSSKKIRLGIPKILHLLSRKGYDIWVYSANYYSMDDVQNLFQRYSVKVDGVITGTGRKTKESTESRKRVENLFSSRYTQTLHIDRDMILRTFADSKDFEEYPVTENGNGWPRAVLAALREMEKHGKAEG